MEYSEVKEQIKQKLPVQKEFGDSENLLELGLSSIVIMRLVNQWRKQGVKVAFGTLMEHPTLKEWWKIIQKGTKKKGKKAKAEKRDIIMERDMRKPFPLTDVQYAYWVGREDNQVLGGIGCHAYLEFDGYGVVPERLQEAWSRIQYHHPMLRASFSENGMQKIESKPYSEKIKINDFSLLTETEAEQEAQAVRRRLSHRKLKIEEGEVAGLELTLLPGNKTRLHIDLDLLIADVQSLQILLRDLAMVYSGVELPEESKDWNFAAYLEQQNVEDREERKKAKEYWSARLKNLPQGPDMPLAKRPEEVKNPVFHRRVVRIGKEEWDCLQRRAKEYQTTPAMLLLTAYSAILERWSKNKSFLITLIEGTSESRIVYVIFHAGTGSLVPYLDMIKILREREFKYTILGIPCIEQDQYLQLPVEHLFVELGKKYAELLIKYKDYKLYFIGHCIGGLIAIETAKELLKQGTEVDLVTMISTNIYDGDDKKREENFQILQSNLILEKVFGRLIGADVRKSGFTITDTKLMEAIRVICQKGKFVEEKLVELTGEYQEVANMCQKLLESSHQERLRSLFSSREGKVRHAENKEDREVLFEIFKHNLLAALYYEVTDYCGNIKLLRCCNQTENFFINMIDGFSEDDMVWRKSKVKDIVTGEVQGDHISCMEFPYIKENINLIIEGI